MLFKPLSPWYLILEVLGDNYFSHQEVESTSPPSFETVLWPVLNAMEMTLLHPRLDLKESYTFWFHSLQVLSYHVKKAEYCWETYVERSFLVWNMTRENRPIKMKNWRSKKMEYSSHAPLRSTQESGTILNQSYSCTGQATLGKIRDEPSQLNPHPANP